jgi:hypothetical protein
MHDSFLKERYKLEAKHSRSARCFHDEGLLFQAQVRLRCSIEWI